MPYGRYRRFGRGRRFGRYRRRRYGYKSRSMFRVARKVIKRYRPQEKKFIDTSINMTADDSGGSLTLLNGVDQGTTDVTRIGNRIKIVSFFCKLHLNPNSIKFTDPGVGSSHPIVRLILFSDKQANGTQAVLGGTNQALLQTDDPLSLRHRDTGKRFHVYLDKLMAFHPTSYTIDSGPVERVTINMSRAIDKFKCMRMMPEYNGTGATITSINTGALYLAILTNIATAIGDATLTGEVRLRFIDA